MPTRKRALRKIELILYASYKYINRTDVPLFPPDPDDPQQKLKAEVQHF
jgi:hypothetical protein